MSNEQQQFYWNGRSGEAWRRNQQRLDRMIAAFGDAAVAAAEPGAGEHVLDVGCGAGATSFALADRVGPEGRVLGLDISAPLIELARSRIPAGAPVSFRLGDASVEPLPERPIDLLYSRFGVMFFDDPTAAFAHLRRALKRDGRVAFVCWRAEAQNDGADLVGVTRDILPPAPPPEPDAPGPFSFRDPERVRRILSGAGFDDVALAPLDHPTVYGEGPAPEAAIEDALDLMSQVGPLSRALLEVPEDVRARALAAVRGALAERVEGGLVTFHGAAWIVTARNRA